MTPIDVVLCCNLNNSSISLKGSKSKERPCQGVLGLMVIYVRGVNILWVHRIPGKSQMYSLLENNLEESTVTSILTVIARHSVR